MVVQRELLDKSPLRLVKNAFNPSTKEVRAHGLVTNWPWPSLSPHNPMDVAPSVVHVPKDEINEFLSKVVKRYIRTVQKFGLSFFRDSFFKRDYQRTSDSEFVAIFTHSVFARFFCYELDPIDKKTFSQDLSSDEKFYKIDFSHVDRMKKIEGIDLYSSVTIFKMRNGQVVPVASFLKGKIFHPEDKDWDLVKLLILQAAVVRLLICEHPRAHFPIDSLIGLSQCLLSKNSVLYKLMAPHFYMQLPLNFAVLYISKSVAHNNQEELYTPFPCTKEGFLESLRISFKGIEGNSAYPAYSYRLAPQFIHGAYGHFLESYWHVIYDFVKEILRDCDREAQEIKLWAKHVAFYIPGFPNAEEISKGDILERVVTSFIHNVSVEHSCDHFNYATFARDKLPLRVRNAFNKKGEWSFEGSLNGEDFARHELATKMYFQTSTLRRLSEVIYEFDGDRLNHVYNFHRRLRELDRSFEKQQRFIALKEIASSIQF